MEMLQLETMTIKRCKPRHFAKRLIFYLTTCDFFVTSLWLFRYSYS